MNNRSYVSRAGEKLAFALKNFNISVENKICADFGSSTGGFVDCLLQNGAAKVYAVDTAYGELAWKLRNNQKVVVLERTNAMHVELPEKMDLITNDTSWTRQKHILPNAIKNLKDDGSIITLIKPHYEAGYHSIPGFAGKRLLRKGVLDEKTAEQIAKHVLEEIQQLGLAVKGFITSPIVGGKGGNTEYVTFLIPVWYTKHPGEVA